MATEVPRTVTMDLPEWLWKYDVNKFLEASKLRPLSAPGLKAGTVRVCARERGRRDRPGLVSVTEIAGSAIQPARFDRIGEAEQLALDADTYASADLFSGIDIPAEVARMHETAVRLGQAGLIAPGIALHKVQTTLADPQSASATVEAVFEDLKEIHFSGSDSREAVFPGCSVHFVQRDEALLHRTKLPAVLVRLAHDERLRDADLAHVMEANEQGEEIFAASSALGDGVMLLDAYLAPLLGALSPFIWAVSAPRRSGTVIYALGRAIAGTTGDALEPIQLLPSRAPSSLVANPEIGERSTSSVVRWWVRRLDGLMAVLSDPAVHANAEGAYDPSRHLHSVLSVDQLFRRTAAIQRLHQDVDARRVLLFTTLDTLERLTSRTLLEMCTLTFAERTLAYLERTVPSDVAPVLLPAARRAVAALADLQEGLFLRRQLGAEFVEFTATDGSLQRLTAEMAAAEYVRVLRNATHGHGSDREDARPRTDALLAHHDGRLPEDLPLLGYMYLLEVLTRPDSLRRTLFASGKRKPDERDPSG